MARRSPVILRRKARTTLARLNLAPLTATTLLTVRKAKLNEPWSIAGKLPNGY
jgi:hypothetical protein